MTAPLIPKIVACYIVRNGRLLMTRRRNPELGLMVSTYAGAQWTPVLAAIHPYSPRETPEEAAVRKPRDELGLDVALERRLGAWKHPFDRL